MEQTPNAGDNLETLVDAYDQQRFTLTGIQAAYQEQLRASGYLDRIIASMHPRDRMAFWSNRFTEAWVSRRTHQLPDGDERTHIGVLFRKPSAIPGNPPRERFIAVASLADDNTATYTRRNIPVIVANSVLDMAQDLQSLAGTDVLPNLSADFLSIVEPPTID